MSESQKEFEVLPIEPQFACGNCGVKYSQYSGQSAFELNALLRDGVRVWLNVGDSGISPFIIHIEKVGEVEEVDEPYKVFVHDIERYSSAYCSMVVDWFVNFCSVHYLQKVKMSEGVK